MAEHRPDHVAKSGAEARRKVVGRERLLTENARLREEKVNLEVLLNANYARAKELESQRDTLLAALREIIEQSDADTWYTEIAEGAISKIEEEK